MIWLFIKSWNSTGKIGHIGRHLAEQPDVEVTMCFRPMRPISPVEFQLKTDQLTWNCKFCFNCILTARPQRPQSILATPSETACNPIGVAVPLRTQDLGLYQSILLINISIILTHPPFSRGRAIRSPHIGSRWDQKHRTGAVGCLSCPGNPEPARCTTVVWAGGSKAGTPTRPERAS